MNGGDATDNEQPSLAQTPDRLLRPRCYDGSEPEPTFRSIPPNDRPVVRDCPERPAPHMSGIGRRVPAMAPEPRGSVDLPMLLSNSPSTTQANFSTALGAEVRIVTATTVDTAIAASRNWKAAS